MDLLLFRCGVVLAKYVLSSDAATTVVTYVLSSDILTAHKCEA
jgi:hypothetical protein